MAQDKKAVKKRKSWKDDLGKTRWVMDVWLTVAFVLVCAPHATGIPIHEWLSFLFIAPLVIHLLLHWDWMVTLPKKFMAQYNAQSKFNAVWDVIFYLMMVMSCLSGFMISRVMLPQLGVSIEHSGFWREMHDISSNLLMPMLGIHLALHWDWIKNMTAKMRKSKKGVA